LGDIQAESGDIIRGQTQFSMFSSSTGWVGTLDTIRTGRMYQLNLKSAAELITAGTPVDLARDTIGLARGWNWLGYTPTFTLSTDVALRNLVALNGDIIKSQTQFAVYVAGTGWIGNLNAMVPLRGYLLYTSNGGRFAYPTQPSSNTVLAKGVANDNSEKSEESLLATTVNNTTGSPWEVNPFDFEFSMSIIAELTSGSVGLEQDTSLVIAAFANDEVRGISKPTVIESLEKQLVFLTVYSNSNSGEDVSFQVYSPKDNLYYSLEASLEFESNGIAGSINNPLLLNPISTSVDDVRNLPMEFELFQNYPNPFNGNTQIKYSLPSSSEVSLVIYNILGQKVASLVNANQAAGTHTVSWSTSASGGVISSGTYFVEMRAGSYRSVKKMLYLK
jgi:hypothetical protein